MSDALENARTSLENLQRFELSTLLSACSVGIASVPDDEPWIELESEKAIVSAPSPIAEALRTLPPYDRKRIGEAIAKGYNRAGAFDDIQVNDVLHNVEGSVGLLADLLIHRAMMVSVATGGDLIQQVNDYYRAREARILERMPPDVHYENPHEDLWAWYHYLKENFGTWAERRQYANKLFGPAIEALAKRSSVPMPGREASGWERVDRALSKARAQLGLASAEEDFQQIGLLCREVLISLGQAVYDPLLHSSPDGVEPSETDANRMIASFIAFAFGGSSNEEVRAHAKASLRLALALQHRRTASGKLAALCLEATSSTVAVISIIARPA